jgi:hypothetical protein
MKTNKNINRLKNSIKLQERMIVSLKGMIIANPETIELCERIIRSLKAQLSILEAQEKEVA